MDSQINHPIYASSLGSHFLKVVGSILKLVVSGVKGVQTDLRGFNFLAADVGHHELLALCIVTRRIKK